MSMMTSPLPLLLLAGACAPSAPPAPPDHAPCGVMEPSEGTAGSPRLADIDLDWRLHDTVGSLVVVTWDQPANGAGRVEFSVDPGEWLRTPQVEQAEGPQDALLLGIPYGCRFAARVVTDLGHGEEISGEIVGVTGDIPAGFPTWELRSADPSRIEPTGPWVMGSVNSRDGGWTDGRYHMWILDRKGRLVWTWPGIRNDMTIYLHASLDGDILWDQSTFWSDFDRGAGSQLHRMKIDGSGLASIAMPGMHHCFTELPDRSIVWGDARDPTFEVIRRAWPDGHVTKVWDCATFEPVTPGDWCHTNAIRYRASTDSLLLSSPSDDSFVVEVALSSGEVLDWWGHIDGAWAFASPDEAFWYQHGTTWTDEGTLLLSSHVSEGSDEAMVREYALDRANRTLREVWRFGDGDGIHAMHAGEAHRLPNGNTLHNTGTTPRIREITPDGDVVWDLSFSGTKLLGRTVLLPDLYALAPE